jgi:hypothetical protein
MIHDEELSLIMRIINFSAPDDTVNLEQALITTVYYQSYQSLTPFV